MASDRDLHGIERFDGTDFPAWKFQIVNLLKAKRLLRIAEGEEKQPHADDERALNDWLERDSQAIGIIMSSIERRLHKPLRITRTAAACWERLRELHDTKSDADIHQLHARFYALTLESQNSLPDFLAEIEEVAAELLDANYPITDEAMMAKLLTNLPPYLGNFLPTWELSPVEDRTLQNLIKLLLREDKRARQREIKEASTSTSAFMAQRFSTSRSQQSSGNYQHPGALNQRPSHGGSSMHSRPQFSSGSYQHPGTFYRPPPMQQNFSSRSAFPSHRCSGPSCHHPQHSGTQFSTSSNISFEERKKRALELLELKKITPCNYCGEFGHWFNECPHRRGNPFLSRTPVRASFADTIPQYYSE